ncbi:hypothetical protein BDV93DRAFT_526801 [Ceratobasidium sp. AG-I]|nr:hypothetical protein BDV93DRAFT_526801 [Ceratobasidium sp. AG-I]
MRLASSFPLLSPSLCLFNWAVSSLNVAQPCLVVAFFKAAYLRLWAALDPAKETWPLGTDQLVSLLEHVDHLMGHTRTFIGSKGAEAVQNALKVSLGSLVWQNDTISLLARTLVAHLQDHEQDSASTFMLGMLPNVESSITVILDHCPPNSQVVNSAYPDWMKTAQLFRDLVRSSNQSKLNRDHLKNCYKKWMKLGTLIFGSRLADKLEACSNPRCPYPDFVLLGEKRLVCGRCFSAAYCSYTCQHTHCVYRVPGDPHLGICVT